MSIKTEAVETCPYCMAENTYPGWDVKTQGFIARCSGCGREIFLCDECTHADDNVNKYCDWRFVFCNENVEGFKGIRKCFRGSIVAY